MMYDDDLERLMKIAKPVADMRPVFPSLITEPGVIISGITRREYFAAMAMQGMLTQINWNGEDAPTKLSITAVIVADALCAELDRTKPIVYGPCEHNGNWTDLENGIGQCHACMAMLPYTAFVGPPVTK